MNFCEDKTGSMPEIQAASFFKNKGFLSDTNYTAARLLGARSFSVRLSARRDVAQRRSLADKLRGSLAVAGAKLQRG